jgi:hypothetical protein
MKRITAVMSAAAVVMMTIGVFAQARPNFAGKWAMQPPAEGAPAAGGGGGGGRGGFGRGGFGQEVTITQDASTITMEYMQGRGGMQKRTYKLDGSESVNQVMGRGGEMAPQTSKAMWEGNKLSITTTTQFGETKQVLSMEGADLVVEQTAPGRGGGDPVTTKMVYKKAQ